tara:strand:- start:1 stop:180 length:180 start_codon:yes stop_codon:yes gene_type:complete
MKDNGWIKIKDFDNSHKEFLENITEVLNDMGISVYDDQIDHEYDDGFDVIITIERKEQE